QIRKVEQELNAQAELRMASLTRGRAQEVAEIDKEIDRLSGQYDQLEGRVRSENARYAALTQPQPLSITEIQQQVLDDNSLLLEYMLGEERSYVWAVTRTNVSGYTLPSRAKIEEAARQFRDLLTVNQPLPSESFQQHQARIRQAEAQMPGAAALLSDL